MHNVCLNKFSVLSVEVSQVKSEKLLKAKITKEGIDGSHRADVMSRKDHHLDRAVMNKPNQLFKALAVKEQPNFGL